MYELKGLQVRERRNLLSRVQLVRESPEEEIVGTCRVLHNTLGRQERNSKHVQRYKILLLISNKRIREITRYNALGYV